MFSENPRKEFVNLKDFLQNVQARLRQAFPASYWVKAEVAGIRQSGAHIYFDLIELQQGQKVAQARAVAFGGEGVLEIRHFERSTGQRFVNGIRIGAQVKVNFHPVYGMSLVLCDIDAELTLGGIELQRSQTLTKLVKENPAVVSFVNGQYITPNTRLSLNTVLQRIALVASPGTDGFQDFIHCIKTNRYQYRFVIDNYSAIVHGSTAARTISRAIQDVVNSGILYDAIVLIRGGGSPADFLPFDDEYLAMTVASCPVPIITGIGHHANQGICDFFANVHTKTPTMAGQFLIDHNHSFEISIDRLSQQLTEKAVQLVMRQKLRQETLQNQLITASERILSRNNQSVLRIRESLMSPIEKLMAGTGSALRFLKQQLTTRSTQILESGRFELQQKLFVIRQQPGRTIKAELNRQGLIQQNMLIRLPQLLKSKTANLRRLQENFDNLSLEKILRRGFAIIKKDGVIITDSTAVNTGDTLQIIRSDNIIHTTVNNLTKRDGTTNEL